MIKIGNILINPSDISSVHRDLKAPISDRDRGFDVIQIVYKNGVVKNFTSAEIGMSYPSFVDELLKNQDKEETDRIFRIMAALKSTTHG